MATYVDGEAPETDSEDEQYHFNLSYLKVRVTINLLQVLKKFYQYYVFTQIGNDHVLESPNVAINNAKDLLLKGNVVDGLTEAQDLLNTPVATELTEDFDVYPCGEPATPAEFFYENELLRRKISESLIRSVNIKC